MKERVIPKMRYIAPYEGKILEFYEGVFESVFVLLNPFFKPTTLNYETYWENDESPKKRDLIEGCETISWESVIEKSKFTHISEIDIALRTSIGGLREKSENKRYETYLNNFLAANKKVYPPGEGDISEFIENKLFKGIQSLNYEWLWVCDEWTTERKLMFIDDLYEKSDIPASGTLFTHDKKILIATHWDSHCSFLCSSKENIEKIVSKQKLEGFFCTPKTEVYWGLYEI